MAIPKTEKGKQTVAIPTPLHRRDLLFVERLHLVPLDLQHCGVVEETGHLRPVGGGVGDWDWGGMEEGHCGCCCYLCKIVEESSVGKITKEVKVSMLVVCKVG